MKTVSPHSVQPQPAVVPPLRDGERLTQAEFHRRYEASPPRMKAELIGGIVHVASPLRLPHSDYHVKLSLVLALYQAGTPGVQVLDNATTILDEQNEPQPDLAMRIRPEFGGQSRDTADEYLEGAPELVAEVAHSSRGIDLGPKRETYEQAGVREYLVLCVAEQELHWFDFGRQRPLTANRRGIVRSRIFPGLWIAPAALWALETAQLVEVLQQGLASRPHAAFVKRLEAASRKRA
jgi:Uma2 family endonuclease